jgi:hypothetical protein
MAFHKIEAYSSLGLTSVKCNIKELPMVEEEKAQVRIKSNFLTDLEKNIFYMCLEMYFTNGLIPEVFK